MKNCTFIEKYLIDYIFGQLPKHIENEINEHLQTCNFCNSELQEMLDTITVLKSLKEEETPRILYFKRHKNIISKLLQFKSIIAIAACCLIFFNAFILFKLYSEKTFNNLPAQNYITKTKSISPEINDILNSTLQKYRNEQMMLLQSKLQELESKLTQQQNQQLTIFRNSINHDTKSAIDNYFKVHEQNRIDDLQNVAETILTLQQKNELEKAQTYQLLNYLMNASEKKTKY